MTQRKRTDDPEPLTIGDPGGVEVVDIEPAPVLVERPPLDEPGLTELFDGPYTINDYIGDIMAAMKSKEGPPRPIPSDFEALVSGPLDAAKFPAEYARFNQLLDKALAELDATRQELAEEIARLNEVLFYFQILGTRSDVLAVDQIKTRLTAYRQASEFRAEISAAFSKASKDDAELIALIQEVAPKYRAYMLVDVLEQALNDRYLRASLTRSYRTPGDLINRIETDARELNEIARDPSILEDPAKCPQLFVFQALVWAYTRRESLSEGPEVYEDVAREVLKDLKAQWREMLEDADLIGPERLDEAAAELGLIDLMSIAEEWTTVKVHYAKLRPKIGTYRQIYTHMNPAGTSDIIASNTWIYRQAGIMTLDQWDGYNPEREEYEAGAVLYQQNAKNLNEKLTLKYTPRPWDRFIMMVYDAIASIYFNSEQWKNRKGGEFPRVTISFYTIRETVAPEYFRQTAKKSGKLYEPGTLTTARDDRDLMDEIRDAANVLMESVIKIRHSETLKAQYDDKKDGVLSDLEQDLNALFAFYSTIPARNGGYTEGIAVFAPPILPYDCMRLGQTVKVPRDDYLTTTAYARYLKDEYDIESVSLSEYDGLGKADRFVIIGNDPAAVRVKGAIITAYRALEKEIDKNGIKKAIDKGMNVFTWERDLYPAVFGTISAPEWTPGENRPQAEAVDYAKIPRKQRLRVKRLALAVLNNLSIKTGVKYTVVGINGREKYGTGVKFKPVSIEDKTPNPEGGAETRQRSLTSYH